MNAIRSHLGRSDGLLSFKTRKDLLGWLAGRTKNLPYDWHIADSEKHILRGAISHVITSSESAIVKGKLNPSSASIKVL